MYDFIKWQKQRLDQFEEKWLEQNLQTDQEYPIDQEPEVWFEKLYWFNANSGELKSSGLED